jgi:hypothetical protein
MAASLLARACSGALEVCAAQVSVQWQFAQSEKAGGDGALAGLAPVAPDIEFKLVLTDE